MRHRDPSLKDMKAFFGVRLSYLIEKLKEEASMRAIADTLGLKYYVIVAIRNGHYERTSLDYLMHVANVMGLEYQVTITRKHGKSKVDVTGMERYTLVNYNVTKSKRGMTISRVQH